MLLGVVVAGGGNSSYIPPTIQTTPERPTINVPFKVSSLVTSGRTTFAIATDGKLYGWGYNANNILTHYETPETSAWDRSGTFLEILTPYHISEVGKVKSLEISGSTVYAITEDNRLYAWGYNGYGQVGNGSRDVYSGYAGGVSTPYEVTSVGKVKSLKISGDTAYAITEDGKLYAWGSGYTSTPQEVTGLVGKVKSIETDGSTAYAITEDGKLYAWGDNEYGQVGNGSIVYCYDGGVSTPYEVTSVGKVKSLKISGDTAYAITEDGKLYAWGINNYGEVGNGRSGYNAEQTTPYEVTSIVGKVKSVEISGSTVYAITEDNRLYAWGYNKYGEVGNGSTGTQTIPYEVTSIVGKVKSIETDGSTVYAITEEGKLYAWGYNEYGEVGNGSTTTQKTPYELTSIVGKVKSLKVGVKVYNGDYLYTVYAITEEGKLYAWGYNGYGEVGNGSTGTQTTPYEVTSIVGKVKSVIGGYTVYAITEEGKLYAWGDNDYGQVGNGSTGTQTTPYEVTSVGKVKSVEIYSSTVYAMTEEGKLYAWGSNGSGQVGNGSTSTQTIPYELTSIVGKVKSLETDSYTVYAITEDNRLYAWGNNEYGQVGNGYYDDTVTTPYYISEVKQFLE